MPSVWNPEKRVYESPVEGEARLAFTRFELPGEAPDFGIALPTGERFRIKVKVEERRAALRTSALTSAEHDLVMTAALLDADDRLARDANGDPVAFAPHAASVAADYTGTEIDLAAALERGLASYAPIVRARAARALEARALAATYGVITQGTRAAPVGTATEVPPLIEPPQVRRMSAADLGLGDVA
jgi:hypothetical protein